MNFIVFGSLNIDKVYRVPHIAAPGETVAASEMNLFCGGKGLNQAIAFARAGAKVAFLGAVGADGQMLLDALNDNGIDTSLIKRTTGDSGHAIIQVDASGQNSITIFAGANALTDKEYIDSALQSFKAGDLIMLQNEIANVDYIISEAKKRGLIVALNPSPCDDKIAGVNLKDVDFLVVNESEFKRMANLSADAAIDGSESTISALNALGSKYSTLNILLTLGENGAIYLENGGKTAFCPIFKVKAVDTTAAGDTFAGFFFSSLLSGKTPEAALKIASAASAISVSRQGASPSIPSMGEVEEFIKKS